jgi:hypothetical protein
MLPFVLRNLREVAVAQDAVRKEAQDSPEFWPSDFLDWIALREASLRDGDLLRDVLGGRALPEILDEATLDRLNAVLEDPGFYERYKERFDLAQASPALRELLEKTSSARKKRASELTEAEKGQIRRLNRMLMELAYVYWIERYDRRQPGTTLMTQSGLGHLHRPAQLNIAMSSGSPQPGQVYNASVLNPWVSTARTIATATVGPAPVVAASLIGTWNAMNTHQQLTALKVFGQTMTATAFHVASKLPLPPQGQFASAMALTVGGLVLSNFAQTRLGSPQPNIGGAMADVLRRPYIDKGNWNVEAPFGLAYYEREAQ